MHGFSTVNGLLNVGRKRTVKEGVDEMIKYLANEPTVGLFFVQRHAQTSMPYLLNIKDKVGEKIHEVTLHTEDIEDSICVVRSMTEYGLPIADDMINDINKSLRVVSMSQQKKGSIQNPNWVFQAGGAGSGTQNTSDYNISSGQQGKGISHSYLSAIFNSAKQKAAGFRWSPTSTEPQSELLVPSSTSLLSAINTGSLSSPQGAEGEELPLSSQLSDDEIDKAGTVGECLYGHDMPSMMETYDKFVSEQETKLEEWLQVPEDHNRCLGAGD